MTVQRKDTLLYKRKKYTVNSSTENDLPSSEKIFPAFASDCWKGYLASWKVRKGRLFLTGIRYTAFGEVG